MSDRQSRKDFSPPVVSMDRQVRTNKIEYDQAIFLCFPFPVELAILGNVFCCGDRKIVLTNKLCKCC